MRPGQAARDQSLDVVRAAAIVMVLVIHSASAGLLQTSGSANWWQALAWGSIARPAVPLFFMCSGALMLCRDITPGRILTHNLPRVVCAMFLWGFVYRLTYLPGAGGFTAENLFQAVKSTLLFEHEFHFYYLHILLLVYAFVPIVRVFVRSASRQELEYALTVWFAVGILLPLLQNVWPFTRVSPISTWWKLDMSYAAIGYGLLGHYLRRHGGSIRRVWYHLALWGGLALTFGGTAVLSLRNGYLNELFLEGMSPGPMLMAFGLFGLALSREQWPEPVVQVTGRLAQAAFCVYLSHILFLKALNRAGVSAGTAPTALWIPLTAALMLLGGYVIWEVLRRIPVARDYLV